MHSIINRFIDRLTTKKGMYTTIILWLAAAALCLFFAPSAFHYSDEHSLRTIPSTSPSVIAQHKIANYFPNEAGFNGRLVLEADQAISESSLERIIQLLQTDGNILLSNNDKINISPNQDVAYIPVTFTEEMTAKHLKGLMTQMQDSTEQTGMEIYLTGPLGEAVHNAVLFSNIDIGVVFLVTGVLFVLLLFIFRPVYLVYVPIIAVSITYLITERLLGFFYMRGIIFTNTALLLMGLLLLFLMVFYAIILFSKFTNALQYNERASQSLADALKQLMPSFSYTGIILLAMAAILYTAYFNDYRNLAFVLGIAVVVAHLGAFTLIPALFFIIPAKAMTNRKTKQPLKIWELFGRIATAKPIHTAVTAAAVLIIISIAGLVIGGKIQQHPVDTDGQRILEDAFGTETFATDTLLLTSTAAITDKESDSFLRALEKMKQIDSITIKKKTKDKKAILYEIALRQDPASKLSMDTIESLMKQEKEMIAKTGVHGEFFITGETARSLDHHNILIRDTIVLIISEIVLLFSLLILFTRSAILSGILLGGNLLTITAALGVGSMLARMGFTIAPAVDSVLYLYMFLLSFGIALTFHFMFHYAGAKRHAPVPVAVNQTIMETSGFVFSISALLAVILAAGLFWPNGILAAFSLIAFIGIIIYMVVIHSLLLPAFLVLTEKNEHLRIIRRKKKPGIMR